MSLTPLFRNVISRRSKNFEYIRKGANPMRFKKSFAFILSAFMMSVFTPTSLSDESETIIIYNTEKIEED